MSHLSIPNSLYCDLVVQQRTKKWHKLRLCNSLLSCIGNLTDGTSIDSTCGIMLEIDGYVGFVNGTSVKEEHFCNVDFIHLHFTNLLVEATSFDTQNKIIPRQVKLVWAIKFILDVGNTTDDNCLYPNGCYIFLCIIQLWYESVVFHEKLKWCYHFWKSDKCLCVEKLLLLIATFAKKKCHHMSQLVINIQSQVVLILSNNLISIPWNYMKIQQCKKSWLSRLNCSFVL